MLSRAGGPERYAKLLSDAKPGALLSYAVRCSGPLDLSDATQANDKNTVWGTSFLGGHADLLCVVPCVSHAR